MSRKWSIETAMKHLYKNADHHEQSNIVFVVVKSGSLKGLKACSAFSYLQKFHLAYLR